MTIRPGNAGGSGNTLMGSLSDNAQGAIFMMVSMAGFVINDTLMKLAAAEVSLFQVMLLRGLVATLLLGLLAWRRGALRPRLGPAGRRLVGLRVCGEIGGTICYLTALFHMPIANATAILQSLPLAVTLGAALALGESVGRRRYLAIAIGFAGVLAIVQPGSEGFTGYALWALAAVGFMVVRDLTTRRLGREIPSIFVALTTAVAITAVGGLVSALRPWQPVPDAALLLLGAAAAFLVIGYLFNVMTMRKGEIGFVSPFRYTILIWAILLGMAVFGEVPNAMALAGAAVVVVTGVYTFYRERLAALRATRQLAPSGATRRGGA
jgi:drug/metabolite transporter (DMT)-like permease